MKKILVIDVGGSNIKVSTGTRKVPLKIPSGPTLTPARMVAAVKKATAAWRFQVVSIGYPGPVRAGKPSADPANLGAGWVRYDFKKAFGKPVKLVNDAAMQALGGYHGGRMLFLGLGTGLGSALVAEGVLMPLELAHLPYRNKREYEDYAGLRGLKRLGRKKWEQHVHAIVAILKHGLQADYVMLGGGQTRKLKKLPPGVRLGTNHHAILGGLRLWDEPGHSHRGGKAFVAHSRRAAPPAEPPAGAQGEAAPDRA